MRKRAKEEIKPETQVVVNGRKRENPERMEE